MPQRKPICRLVYTALTCSIDLTLYSIATQTMVLCPCRRAYGYGHLCLTRFYPRAEANDLAPGAELKPSYCARTLQYSSTYDPIYCIVRSPSRLSIANLSSCPGRAPGWVSCPDTSMENTLLFNPSVLDRRSITPRGHKQLYECVQGNLSPCPRIYSPCKYRSQTNDACSTSDTSSFSDTVLNWSW